VSDSFLFGAPFLAVLFVVLLRFDTNKGVYALNRDELCLKRRRSKSKVDHTIAETQSIDHKEPDEGRVTRVAEHAVSDAWHVYQEAEKTENIAKPVL
jgi:hypothetical protein